MDPALWQQIREVFHAAVELPAGQRERYLNGACTDAAMRREVESLLKSHEDAGDLLEVPALKFDPENSKSDNDPWIGNSIGSYQVIAKIGQGGMGIVYRAMRIDNHYFKQVAIKLARTGLGSEHHFVLKKRAADHG
jgi:serine/threonine protein kinase